MSPFILHRSIPRDFFLPYCFVPAVFRFCTSLSDKVNVLFVFLASFVISTVWVDETKTIHMTPTNIEKKTQFVPRLPWFRGAAFQGPATVQLATPKSCLVVHLVRHPSGRRSQACSPILKAVLCDECFVKAGCALDEDMLALYDIWYVALPSVQHASS